MLLEASNLTVVRGGRAILDNVSARFDAPGLVAVIGPNGAGKSTFLSALAGLLKPDAGEARIEGAPVLSIDRRKLAKRRAYLPQNARCEWPISVERVVALGLTPTLPAFGDLNAGDKARVAAMLELCDLSAKQEQAATTLSGGELARTMLGRAMVGDPEILIADEPIAGLDPRHALDAMHRLRAHSAKRRLVIVALHDLGLAAAFADRVIAIKDGAIAADGAADAVFTPALLRDLFEVDARIARDDAGVSIRFVDAGRLGGGAAGGPGL
ncbi:MAG TPA: ABC transporter ATP-binding protein [Terricaulis sp.]|nr:ABC transporter ATP-binding protein [Terricaulis sp.]